MDVYKKGFFLIKELAIPQQKSRPPREMPIPGGLTKEGEKMTDIEKLEERIKTLEEVLHGVPPFLKDLKHQQEETLKNLNALRTILVNIFPPEYS